MASSLDRKSAIPSIDAQARTLLLTVWQSVTSRPPSLSEMHTIQSLARVQTFYALWPVFRASRNWGALRGKDGGLLAFKTHREGATALVRTILSTATLRDAAGSGNADVIAYRLGEEGWPLDSVDSLANRLSEASGYLAREFREPKALRRRGGLLTEQAKKAARVGGAIAGIATIAGLASSFFEDKRKQ